MARSVLIEEFHVTVTLPRGLARRAYDGAARTLSGRRFRTALRRGIVELFGRYPSLGRARVTLSR